MTLNGIFSALTLYFINGSAGLQCYSNGSSKLGDGDA